MATTRKATTATEKKAFPKKQKIIGFRPTPAVREALDIVVQSGRAENISQAIGHAIESTYGADGAGLTIKEKLFSDPFDKFLAIAVISIADLVKQETGKKWYESQISSDDLNERLTDLLSSLRPIYSSKYQYQNECNHKNKDLRAQSIQNYNRNFSHIVTHEIIKQYKYLFDKNSIVTLLSSIVDNNIAPSNFAISQLSSIADRLRIQGHRWARLLYLMAEQRAAFAHNVDPEEQDKNFQSLLHKIIGEMEGDLNTLKLLYPPFKMPTPEEEKRFLEHYKQRLEDRASPEKSHNKTKVETGR
ncbi:hypothetical protein MnTg02_03006 [bacterium MnTg02]|nr:hypothetical protein MnTg02_03006 [bacterium MnTg02]